MAKSKQIRENPTSLNESTLETNIMSEIASLFRYPSGFSYKSRLQWLFNLPKPTHLSLNNKKVKIYRLTPREEYHGGGWDSKIVIPNHDGTSRAVFIQFKSGKRSKGNEIPNSIFNTNIKKPNNNAEFKFNNNTNNNQHQTLKDLLDELVRKGLPSKSVMYGFPRITDLETFDKLEEDLLLHTTFLSLQEMDTKAKAQNTNLYDGNVHHFRTCFYDDSKREISSDPFSIGKPEDSFGLLYEILLVKFAYWRNQLIGSIPLHILNEEFYFLLADFLHINPFKLYDFDFFYPPPYEKELKYYYSSVEKNSIEKQFEYFGNDNNQQFNNQWRKDLFTRIIKFVEQRRNELIDVQNEIPAEYTFSLSEEMTLEINGKDLVYNMLVF